MLSHARFVSLITLVATLFALPALAQDVELPATGRTIAGPAVHEGHARNRVFLVGPEPIQSPNQTRDLVVCLTVKNLGDAVASIERNTPNLEWFLLGVGDVKTGCQATEELTKIYIRCADTGATCKYSWRVDYFGEYVDPAE